MIEEVLRFTVRRYRCRPDEAEEFVSLAKLKLIEDDYAVFRKFAGRSTLRTYLAAVLQRSFLDYRIQRWGKWRPSARARRLGETALRLERLLYRDGRCFEEACEILRRNEGVTEEPSELVRIAAQLPVRRDRRTESVEALEGLADRADAEAPVLVAERKRQHQRVHQALQRALGSLGPQDRLLVRLRFEEGMPPRLIARALDLETKNLYRQIERVVDRLRRALAREGVGAAEVNDVLDKYEFDQDAIPGPQSNRLEVSV